MAPVKRSVFAVVVLLSLFGCCSAQCSPTPPAGLTVPAILTMPSDTSKNNLRPKIGGHGTDWWTVFSETQVREYGLWCQVLPEDNMGMGDNIGDWYYPSGDTPDGSMLVPTSDPSNTVPYQSLKCANQTGLVLDGDVINNQGIVRCTTNITGLNRQSNYFVVYSDSVFNNYKGPSVDTTMSFSLLSSRDTQSSIMFTLKFNVSYGPPSAVDCRYNGNKVLFKHLSRQNPSELSREVIRSHYFNSSYPDMTRVTLTQTSPRQLGTYTCTVTVEGRVNINDIAGYNFANKGGGTTSVSITVAGTPTGVTATRTGYDCVSISWTAPSTGTPPAGYEVFYQLTGVNTTSIVSGGNTSNTELTLTGLTEVNYSTSFFVVSYGAEGDPVLPSNRSETATIAVTDIYDIPQLSSTPTLVPSASSIMVSWSPTSHIPLSYRISYSCQLICGSSVTNQTVTVDGSVTTHTVSATPGSSCVIGITAVFCSNSSTTVTSSTNTTSAAPTGAPEGLTSMSVESRSLSVVWGTVPCPHQRGPITGYRLRYSNGTPIVNTTGEGSRQHVLTGLTPFTNYSVQVAAVNDGGIGPYSTPLAVETLQDDQPTPMLPSSPCVIPLSYTAALGGVSVLLVISLVGNIVYTVVVCVLMRASRKEQNTEKVRTVVELEEVYDQPDIPNKHERIDVSNNKAYVAAHNQPTSIEEVHYVDVHL